jgi:hypothetical protein
MSIKITADSLEEEETVDRRISEDPEDQVDPFEETGEVFPSRSETRIDVNG